MKRRSRILAATGLMALVAPMAAHAAPSADPTTRFEKAPSASGVKIDPQVLPEFANDARTVDVIVEMTGDPVAVVQAKAKRNLSGSEKTAVKQRLRAAQDQFGVSVRSKGGKVEATMQSAYNGVRVSVSRNQVAAVSKLAGVKAVHPVPVREIENATSVPSMGVPQVWQDTGFTGKGVKVAIIDSGIDYTHADFAGPGTVAAFNAAKATSADAPDPALVGPNAPRIKGGWDFVGDDYDASKEGSKPKPDANPLDCGGHGSHVAGSAAGGGVTADGKAYTGPYNAATAKKDWKVGPGVAPQADLYALRVFGCDGSTDVVVEAIDWAVANDMDVINMSLGSPYGRADDADAVAASNAVAAGLVVVASAGNSGHNPYLTGSPGTGKGVINVAAVDSTEKFPAATIALPGGTSIQAINANGAPLPTTPLKVVVLKDDPATGANEALGCSVDAYTKAGIVPGGNQVAVTVRGTCARVARGVFGQKAGAAAVVMVNNTADFPPYEGPIRENPDTGEQYQVTIPLLGVRGVLGAAPTQDGDNLVAAEGFEVSFSATTMNNPSFRAPASFTSGGPRSGDSGNKPSVAAPGVSIASAGVGTGNDYAYNSGTSMAAPHVTGVAALVAQAHPGWSASDLSAAITNTADPDKINGYQLTLTGTGLVDTKQAVGTKVVALGDSYTVNGETRLEPSLSFGFAESTSSFQGTRTLTLSNHGTSAKVFTIGSEATPQSRTAKVSFSRTRVTVPAGRTVDVTVKLSASAKDVPTSLTGDDQFSFWEISGNVTATSGSEVLRVPYLLVPRSNSNVVSTSSPLNRDSIVNVKVTNKRGAIGGAADFYTWGLGDGKDVDVASDYGVDLRAAGVQSFQTSADDQLIVFAINTHRRWSNAANNEFDVLIDTDSNGTPDWIVFTYDSGRFRTGYADGLTEVFAQEVATKQYFATGYMAQAPTDSSTILLPLDASSLGLSEGSSEFRYAVESYVPGYSTADAMSGVATYDPWNKAVTDGLFAEVGIGQTVTVPVKIDAAARKEQKPLGIMTVSTDNQSGSSEAGLLSIRGNGNAR